MQAQALAQAQAPSLPALAPAAQQRLQLWARAGSGCVCWSQLLWQRLAVAQLLEAAAEEGLQAQALG